MESFNVKISVINPDYSAEYQKEWGWLNKGENSKYGDEFSWGVDNVKEYKYMDNISFEISYNENALPKKSTLKNVCVLELINKDGAPSRFIVSKSLIKRTRQLNREKDKKRYFYFHLLPNIEYVTLGNCIYISANELPEELE